MTGALDVWLYGTLAATVRPERSGIALRWSDEALRRWGNGSRVLSHLLPVGTPEGRQPTRVRVWLEGLLPEGRARSTMAAEHRIDPDDTLAMLAVYGKDTAGAVVLVDEGAPDPATTGRLEPVDADEIAAMLTHAARHGGGGERLDSLTSLAGLEPKVALAKTPGGWARVRGGAPSTHILKLSRPDRSATRDLIDTEAAALDLARRVGLTSVQARVERFADVRAIVVERYDRVTDGGSVRRVHQEDLAQALGLSTADPDRKFQRGRALPSYAAAARVLTDGGSTTDPLLRLATFTVLVGNTDAHAKNHSFVRQDDGARVRLAPAYDVSMHEHTGVSSGLLALDVAGRRAIADITVDDLVAEGVSWGLPPVRARRAVTQTVEATSAALVDIDRSVHPGVSAAAWDHVESRVQRLR
ncbi:type II toxin-antitoxin system HipA family toxin [Cellulomonas sp. URHD0024]|uniref:type II toxin-antitoxin system HipA family toxin n=1 Tax=Cellulomonas sp. URHD0024 TaxID=1302620 RepID=UPI00041C737E|nr:HipA domain-containing protein [Cellulomonas sp. URHD0024]